MPMVPRDLASIVIESNSGATQKKVTNWFTDDASNTNETHPPKIILSQALYSPMIRELFAYQTLLT